MPVENAPGTDAGIEQRAATGDKPARSRISAISPASSRLDWQDAAWPRLSSQRRASAGPLPSADIWSDRRACPCWAASILATCRTGPPTTAPDLTSADRRRAAGIRRITTSVSTSGSVASRSSATPR